MRVLIVSPSLNYGGAERVASIWANTFVQKGYDVFFVTNLQNGYEYSLDERINLLPLTPIRGLKFIRYIKAITNLRKYYRTYHIDVIIGVMWVCSLLAKLASFGKGIPVVATEHNAFERPQGSPMSFKDRFAKFYMNYLYDYVTVLTISDYEIVKNRFKKVSVMPNPLLLQPTKDVLLKEKVVLAAGRLDAWHYKGFDVLIRAWARVVSSLEFQNLTPNPSPKGDGNYGWKLQIAGTGSEESLNYLKQLCKENGVEDSVEFLGFRKDVEKLYRDSSIFVLSSRYEGFGLVLIEAMSQGCACVACDYKGRQREIMSPTPTLPRREGDSSIESLSLGTRNMKPDARLCRFRSYDGERTRNLPVEACETGILCEPDDVESLAAGIQKMIEDDEFRESVRKNAIERSKYYSIVNTMDRWESLFKQVIGT